MPWPFASKSRTSPSQAMQESSPSPSVRFAFRLFRELTRTADSPNVFFSPSSVLLCLTLVHELASGDTRQDMAAALEIAGLPTGKMEDEIGLLKSAFRPRAEAEVSFANALWLSTHAHIDEHVAERLRGLYESELVNLDFGSGNAVATINAWVNTQTRGKISQIVNELSPYSALVAINAVYFKGVWQSPFRRERTQEAPFRTAAGPAKQLQMMRQSGTYLYYEDGKLQMAALPYKGELSMYIVLPASGANGEQFLQNVTSGLWESWLAQARGMEGTICLPRFKANYAAQLKSALTTLGMGRAFDQNRAEFEQIHTDRPPVWIDQVVHRALVDVNEEGTEAAAVTGAVAVMSAIFRKPPQRFSLIVDRPFLVVIRDQGTKAILFMGWIGDPEQG